MNRTRNDYAGVWSATPTPLTERLRLDRGSLRRTVEHHVRLGIRGLFVGGTSGEGPMLPDADRRQLVRDVVKHNKGRMIIAAQVTDNSAARVVDNIKQIRDEGADLAVVAQPLFFQHANEQRLAEYYIEICDRSPLPIGFYDRGQYSSIPVTPAVARRVLRHPNVAILKDSTSDPERMKIGLAAREKRPELTLLNGNEFMAAEYMEAGYDGMLFGGAIFNGYLAGLVRTAVLENRLADARRRSKQICRINFTVFGGKSLKCWLAGQKRLCVELGIFRSWRNYYGYALTPSVERAIVELVKRDGHLLRGKATPDA